MYTLYIILLNRFRVQQLFAATLADCETLARKPQMPLPFGQVTAWIVISKAGWAVETMQRHRFHTSSDHIKIYITRYIHIHISHFALAAGFFGKWCHCKSDWHFTFHSHSFYVEMAAKHIKKTLMNLEKEAAKRREKEREGKQNLFISYFMLVFWMEFFLFLFFYLHVSLDFVG